MKSISFLYSIIAFLIIGATIAFAHMETADLTEDDATQNIDAGDPFETMMTVLTHKRCVNCHPSGNTPRQGEDSHLHYFDVVRGDEGHGLSGYSCITCHSDQNNDYSGVPGAPHWALAPDFMAREGKTKVEIATQMMDTQSNGGRSPDEIMEHLTEHELVLWAWDPGINAEGIEREKPPVPKDEYIQAVKDWINAGAIIPAE